MATTDALLANLPYSLEAEQAVLGAILIDPDTMTIALERITTESFYKPEHRGIFAVCVSMFSVGESIDAITVLNEIIRKKIFDSDEAAKVFIAKLHQAVPVVSNVESYCEILKNKQYLRSLMTIAQDIIENVADGEENAGDMLDRTEQQIYDIRQGKEKQGLRPLREIMTGVYDHLQSIITTDGKDSTSVNTGFVDLDRKLLGMNNSDLVLLASRPAMGKTSFAINIATNIAKHTDKAVAIFSLEMADEQLALRMLSSEASVKSTSLRTGELSGEDWIRLSQSAASLSERQIYIDDTSSITIPEMRAKLRKIKNLGVVLIDYLQLMSSGSRIENRVQEVSALTRNLKIMAKDFNVPIITLSQLSRAVESRTEHRPRLSDLRESGSIEQDADIVMFLYRDIYYDEEAEFNNRAECIIGKNRHGETGSVDLIFDGQFTRFSTAENRYEE